VEFWRVSRAAGTTLEKMDFVAVAKTGVHIYDASKSVGQRGDDFVSADLNEPVASLPPAPGAAGCAWSRCGSFLATVDNGTAVIWNAEKGYEKLYEVPGVGGSGGVRAIQFSPKASFLVTFEKFETNKCPENVHIWDLRAGPQVTKLRSNVLKGYSSGAIPLELIQWSTDESICLELVPGEGLVALNSMLQPEEPRRVVPEPAAAKFQISAAPVKGAYCVSVYVPEACNSWGAFDASGAPGQVLAYSMDKVGSVVTRQTLPRKLNDVTMRWNVDGTALLALASSDVDETGASYFGTTTLFWMRVDQKATERVSGPEDGLVQDFAWSPKANEFLIIVGMMPATTKLYSGKTGKLVTDGVLGTSRRNTLRWNPFGRFLVVGGFGALPGDLDFYERVSGETICSFRAALTVDCGWAPDGRHFLCCTTTPRMNEDNKIVIFSYTGEQVLKLDFRPSTQEGGGRKAADAGAMLYAASWRPDGRSLYKDRPASPPRGGARRRKGLPSEGAGGGATSTASAPAYRPKAAGAAGNGSVAAMMRGEVEAPKTEGWGSSSAPMTWEEEARIKKEQKDAAKRAKEAVEEAAKQAKAEVRAAMKEITDADKKLIRLKKQLAQVETAKDKEWDELTSEDEGLLEGEFDLRAQIAALEIAQQ